MSDLKSEKQKISSGGQAYPELSELRDAGASNGSGRCGGGWGGEWHIMFHAITNWEGLKCYWAVLYEL